MESRFDVIVIGAGHAGVEAARAAARMGCRVAICTLSEATVAHMPCNPAIGGTAKGHLVREIDALGGLMGEAIDATGIQFKLLNRSRGPAVRSPRAQADKRRYGAWVAEALRREERITWVVCRVGGVLVRHGRVLGVDLETGGGEAGGETLHARAVVVTTGTFLNGLVHVGQRRTPAGRAGEPPSQRLAESLKALGLPWGRLKTGTPPRLHRRSIRFERLERALGDEQPVPFSFMTGRIDRRQIECHQMHTTERVHEIVRANIQRSPLYNGQIEGIGPRYCPSLEDKVMRFPHHERHQIFLEPEGVDADEVYVNGYSMSLPVEVQESLVHALPGLEDAEMMRPGYAVEYDFVQPTALSRSYEAKDVAGLFLAGQVNGTSGYEEAAGQGVLAGINAARAVACEEPFVLGRDEAYLGVLADDLTTRGCLEPYRMFTSRAEYRLLLRIDNADLRLTERGREVGLVDDRRWARFQDRRSRFEENARRVARTTVTLADGNRARASQALRRPDVELEWLARGNELRLEVAPGEEREDFWSVETHFKYAGYLERQEATIERARRLEHRRIPASFSYSSLPGLSREIAERLTETRPDTLGQALRIPGVTPAAVALIGAKVSA
ncbi:MAG: tRNA uridine-5-carboxymethylaminomethyl(34) synthesis enzyme MnmG [Acidobacteria bacterium]|nr:tRNA uridine-5-carboxymethylaminomethyl(34) synthesis enzyme MnmG [Acidobacteriota bacterium]